MFFTSRFLIKKYDVADNFLFFKMDFQPSLLRWQENLLKKEKELNEYEKKLVLYENNLKNENEKLNEMLKIHHCICCRFNVNIPIPHQDTIYIEWGFFKRITTTNSESRIGVTSVGEVLSSNTFSDLFQRWLNTEIGQNYKNSNLISIYLTRLDLTWTANDLRMVDDHNSKLTVCEKSGRYKIKYMID